MSYKNVRKIGAISFLFLSLVNPGFAGGKKTEPYLRFEDSKLYGSQFAINLFKRGAAEIFTGSGLKESGLDSAVFYKAVTGFYNLKALHRLPDNSDILTIIDYSKPSAFKRLWVVNMKSHQLLLNTWVAHGQGSGLDTASSFSNERSSYQSSLGFYITKEVYRGKHGRSLKIAGQDMGFNDQAMSRNIVIHAAEYVTQKFINVNGRLGRSQGCPAVSPAVINQVIELLQGQSLIFANGTDSHYTSKYLDTQVAAMHVLEHQVLEM